VRFSNILIILVAFNLLANKCAKNNPTINPLSCNERALLITQDDPEYIMPFPPGKSYILSQSYCNENGGHSNQLAYDFALSIGDTVCCMRSGIVKELREDQPDDGGLITASNHNYIMIEHVDGTVAFYAHLKQNSVMVEVNDQVTRGEIIALSGNSGNTLNFPHLHIGLYEDYPPVETYDLPITFINIQGPVDNRGVLIADSMYTALPYE
jgi:murein DD-endopeptidase MepM/ murein hydrolase activator NlpD